MFLSEMKFLLVLATICFASIASYPNIVNVDEHRDILGSWALQPREMGDCREDVFALEVNEHETYFYSTCDLPHGDSLEGCEFQLDDNTLVEDSPEKCYFYVNPTPDNLKITAQIMQRYRHVYKFLQTVKPFLGSESVEKCVFENLPTGKFCSLRRVDL